MKKDKLQQEYKNYISSKQNDVKKSYEDYIEERLQEAKRESKLLAIMCVILMVLFTLLILFPPK